MAQVHLLVVSLSVLVTFTLAAIVSPTTADPTEADIKVMSKQLVSDVRQLASEAKKGMAVKTIYKNALELQSDASDLIQSLPSEVPECETNLVIKLAAAGIGSHEVLTLLLADDGLSVLDGRLALSLAFLERVAQQMEDELALSTDVGPHLAAIVFGANATSSIAETADEVITPVISTTTTTNDNNGDNKNNLVRRQIKSDSGFSVDPTNGLKWTSSNGRTSVNVKPTLSKGGLGGEIGLGLNSEDGRTRFNLQASRNPYEGSGLRGNLGLTSKDGRTQLSVRPSWTQKGGPAIGADLTRTFAKGRGSVRLGGTYDRFRGPGVNFGVGLRF